MGTAQSKKESTIGNTTKAPPVDQFVTPTGLYPTTNNWELRTIKKLVVSKKLAPLFHGKEKEKETDFPNLEECPICFLNYPSLNRSLCCKKSICSECYIQIKKPNLPATCPFCNRQNYNIVYTGALSTDERKKDEEEQQKVIELKIKIRQEELERDKQRQEERKNRQSTSPSSSIDGEHEPVSQSLPTTPSIFVRSLASSQDSSTPQPREISTSYPSSPSSTQFQRRSAEVEPENDIDFDDMMLMEAIRLSLVEHQKMEPKPLAKNTRPTSPENNEHRAFNDSHADDSLQITDARDHSILNTSEHRVPSERESNSISNAETSRETPLMSPVVAMEMNETSSRRSSQSGNGSKEEIVNLRSSLSSEQQEQYELELAISLSLQQKNVV